MDLIQIPSPTKKGVRVISIDPGIRGLATTFIEGRVYIKGSITDLCPPDPNNKKSGYKNLTDEKCITQIKKWFLAHESAFREFEPDAICIEKQLVLPNDSKKGFMVGIAWAIFIACSTITENVHFIAPITYKRFFGISRGNYKENKKYSRECFEKLFPYMKERKDYQELKEKDKSDISDSFFVGLYWVRTVWDKNKV